MSDFLVTLSFRKLGACFPVTYCPVTHGGDDDDDDDVDETLQDVVVCLFPVRCR